MKNKASILLQLLVFATIIVLGSCSSMDKNKGNLWTTTSIGELYKAAPEGVKTRWVSPGNPSGEKGKGGLTNKGAKGNAF